MRFVAGFALAFGLLSGCSSSGSSGNSAVECTAAAACGGDLTGTWNVAAACFSDAQKAELEDSLKACPTGTASLSSLEASGTAAYDSGALNEDVTVMLKVAVTVPTSCLNGLDCASLQTRLAAETAEGVVDAACRSAGDGCSCTYGQTIHVKQESSYTVNGSTITETDATDGSITTFDYCVAGNKLTEKESDGSISVYTR